MSMIAKFVQIEPSRLTELIDDPGQISDLFTDQVAVPRNLLQMTDNMRKQLSAAPQMMAATLERLDPRIRASMEERLKKLGTSLEAAGLSGRFTEGFSLRRSQPDSSSVRGAWQLPSVVRVLAARRGQLLDGTIDAVDAAA